MFPRMSARTRSIRFEKLLIAHVCTSRKADSCLEEPRHTRYSLFNPKATTRRHWGDSCRRNNLDRPTIATRHGDARLYKYRLDHMLFNRCSSQERHRGRERSLRACNVISSPSCVSPRWEGCAAASNRFGTRFGSARRKTSTNRLN